MKSVGIYYIFVLIFLISAVNGSAQTPVSSPDSPVASEFVSRVRGYTRMREDIEDKMPTLSKQATAAEIEAHEKALLKSVLAARKGATRGSIFTPEAERLIRSIIASQYQGRTRTQLIKDLSGAENASVRVKVNAVYPEASELLETPPTLLLALPPLPKQVRYRFVGRNLLLVDRENHLIVDYMTNALP